MNKSTKDSLIVILWLIISMTVVVMIISGLSVGQTLVALGVIKVAAIVSTVLLWENK